MANRSSTPRAEPPEESRQSKLRKPHRDSTADGSNTPTSKSLVISIKPCANVGGAVDELLRNARVAAAA